MNSELLVVCPHADDLDRAVFVEHLVDKPMLYVDAPGICAGEVSDQLLEGRRTPSRIHSKNLEQVLHLAAKTALSNLSGVFLRLLREYDPPGADGLYQPAFSEVFESGVRKPFRIDSRMPGIERR